MSPRRAAPVQENKSGLPTWVIAVGIGVIVVVAAIALFALQTPQAAPVVTDIAKSGKIKGNAQAPIELIEISDFQ